MHVMKACGTRAWMSCTKLLAFCRLQFIGPHARRHSRQAVKARLSLMHARAQERLHLPLELHLSEVNWHNSANPQDFCMPTQHSSCLQALQRSKQLVPSADVSADEAASISISLAFGNGYALGLNYAPAVQGPTDGDSALNASIVTAFALGSGCLLYTSPSPRDS